MRVEPNLLVQPTAALEECMRTIDKNGRGVALVVDAERRLLGTLTDGDLRRAVLARLDLSLPASTLLRDKAPSITQPVGTPDPAVLQLMRERRIRHLPLVDADGRVEALALLEELLPADRPAQAVVMAGGLGSRLMPLTRETPKPMLPVGDRPIMQRIIEQLRESGVRRVNVSAHYLPERISEHFGDGSAYGVDIEYVREDSPLGTAGAIGLLDDPRDPILVVNGDIVTRLDFRALLTFHREQRADLTVAVRKYKVQVPYGVVECEGARVLGIVEKPLIEHYVNAGIYVLEPSVRAHIPPGKRFDMPDLISALVARGGVVASFPVWEYWVDIGQLDDYERAKADAARGALAP